MSTSYYFYLLRATCLVLLACGIAVGGGAQSRATAAPLACRSRTGQAVDWWVLIKHPRGLRYSCLDAAAPDVWQHGDNLNDPTASPTQATLSQVDGNNVSRYNDQSASFFYNDADPGGTEHWEYAHAKGALVFDAATGFWLTHSIPQWPRYGLQPPAGSPADVAQPQQRFAQSALCVSFNNSDALPALLAALLRVRPFVFHANLPASLAEAFPAARGLLPTRAGADGDSRFAKAFTPRRLAAAWRPAAAAIQWLNHLLRRSAQPAQPAPAAVSIHHLKTAAGVALRMYAKPREAPLILADYIAAHERLDMWWETWRLGAGALPSNCSLDDGASVDAGPAGAAGTAGAAAGSAAAAGIVAADDSVSARCSDPLAPGSGRSAQLFASVNIQALNFSTSAPGDNASWSWSEDHSKWGIASGGAFSHNGDSVSRRTEQADTASQSGAVEAAPPLVCFGDLNREAPQANRGGVFVCLEHPDLWAALSATVQSVQSCALV